MREHIRAVMLVRREFNTRWLLLECGHEMKRRFMVCLPRFIVCDHCAGRKTRYKRS